MSECKLALGTVQFGVPYGVNNTNGIPTESELKQILNFASNSGINFLDTAFAYGNSEARIGELAIKNSFNIISKFSTTSNKSDFEINLKNSLSNLQIKSIYGYLAHSANNLIQYPQVWDLLNEAKEKGKVKKIGYSIYTPLELEELLSLNMIPDIVQVPYSLLDRSFENTFSKLKEYKCEIHVRSIFLQGLYLLNPHKLPQNLKEFKSVLLDLNKLCYNYKTTVYELALNFVYLNPNIDKVVIGIDNLHQLKKNLKSIDEWGYYPELMEKVRLLEINNKKLLNPSNW
jgi:aryl-alcohol dehydrogenase-like predicted oxidoreductase